MALMALQEGLVSVVKASITGSIIGNILLVLGVSVFAGGLKFRHQRFSATAVRAATASLMLAAIGLLVPSVFHFSAAKGAGGWTPEAGQKLSLAIAIVLFGTYLCTLLFSLLTHKQLFQGTTEASAGAESIEPMWSRRKSLVVLLVSTGLVALLSEFLV